MNGPATRSTLDAGRTDYSWLSSLGLALHSQTVDLSFTSAGQQRLGWHGVWARALGSPGDPTGLHPPGSHLPGTHPPGTQPTGRVPVPDAVRRYPAQTNPVLAGLAWGPALEAGRTEVAPGGPELDAIWNRAVTALAPLVASIGDRMFHAALPLCLGSGLIVLGLHFSPWSVFSYPIFCALLVLATAVHGWNVGRRGEDAVATLLEQRQLERWTGRLEGAGRVLSGLALGLVLASTGMGGGRFATLLTMVLLAGVGSIAWHRGLSPLARVGILLTLGAAASRWLG